MRVLDLDCCVTSLTQQDSSRKRPYFPFRISVAAASQFPRYNTTASSARRYDFLCRKKQAAASADVKPGIEKFTNRVPAGQIGAFARRKGYVDFSTPTVILVESPRINIALITENKPTKIRGRYRHPPDSLNSSSHLYLQSKYPI